MSVYKPLSIGLFTIMGYISVKYYSLLYSYWIYGEIIFALLCKKHAFASLKHIFGPLTQTASYGL